MDTVKEDMASLRIENVKIKQEPVSVDPLTIKEERRDSDTENEVISPIDPLAKVKIEHEDLLESQAKEVQASEYFVSTSDLDNIVNIKKERDTDIDTTIKTELLSEECDIPAFKSETTNSDYIDIAQPCSSKQSQKVLEKSEIGSKSKTVKKKKFPCPVCRKNFLSQSARKRHFDRHFKKNFVLCSYCGTYYKSKCEFLNHNLICHISKSSSKKLKLRRKKQSADVVNKQPLNHVQTSFVCLICNKSFSRNQGLVKHSRSHTGEKPFKCELCSKSFSQNYSLRRHKLVHEKKFELSLADIKKVSLKCEVCSKVFTHQYKLTRHKLCHQKKPDIDLKPFMCEICSNQYASKHSLDNHLKTHTGERPHACTFCDRRFFRKKLLKDHLLIHSGERPFKCQICPKSFTQKSKLNTHMRVHGDNKPFKCQICSKGFIANCRLTRHMLIHRDTRRFQCVYCPKQFIEKRNLDAHLLLHDGTKPFKCDICSKAFTWRHNLNHHMKIHSDESFQCEICKEHFSRYHILKNHIRTHSTL